MTCCFCNGNTKQSSTTFTVDLNDKLTVIRHVPCDECVQCGETFLDSNTLDYIDKIIDNVENTRMNVAILDYSETLIIPLSA